jgi:hypothetical protein
MGPDPIIRMVSISVRFGINLFERGIFVQACKHERMGYDA